MITVYVLKSQSGNYRYVGITKDLPERMQRHNQGRSTATKRFRPFQIFLSEKYPDYATARVREKFLKSGAGREYLNTLSS